MNFNFGSLNTDFSILEKNDFQLNYIPEELKNMRRDFYKVEITCTNGAKENYLNYESKLFRYDIFPPQLMAYKILPNAHSLERKSTILQKVKLGPIVIGTAVVVTKKEQNETLDQKISQFSYGTTLGHPEQGEATFRITLNKADNRLFFEIETYSRPGTILTKVGSLFSRYIQKNATLKALAHFVS